MAQWSHRTKTTVRHEYVLPRPANLAEVSKAMSAAYEDYTVGTGKNVADDSVWLTHNDDELIIFWEES